MRLVISSNFFCGMRLVISSNLFCGMRPGIGGMSCKNFPFVVKVTMSDCVMFRVVFGCLQSETGKKAGMKVTLHGEVDVFFLNSEKLFL